MKLTILAPLIFASSALAQYVCELDGRTYVPDSTECKIAQSRLTSDIRNSRFRIAFMCCVRAKAAAESAKPTTPKPTPTPTPTPTKISTSVCPTNFVGPLPGPCTTAKQPQPTGYVFPSFPEDKYGWWAACADGCNSGEAGMRNFCMNAPWHIKPLNAKDDCIRVIGTIGSLWGGNTYCYDHCERYWPQR